MLISLFFLQDWIAFTKLRTANFTLSDSLAFTNNNSSQNKQDKNAFGQVKLFHALSSDIITTSDFPLSIIP